MHIHQPFHNMLTNKLHARVAVLVLSGALPGACQSNGTTSETSGTDAATMSSDSAGTGSGSMSGSGDIQIQAS